MKKILQTFSIRAFIERYLFLSLLAVLFTANASATTIYSTNFGTTSTFPTGWTPTGGSTAYSDNSTSASSGYSGASGSCNASNGTSGTATLIFNNSLSTIGYTNVNVTFGARKTSTGSTPTFQYSTDNGSTWNTITYTDVANNSTWGLISVNLASGAGGASNLEFKFTSNSSANTYRIDDFKVDASTSQTTFYFKSNGTGGGNWNNVNTWQASSNGTSGWAAATTTPKYTASTVTIQSGDSIIFNSTDTVDQVINNGILTYASGGSTVNLNNGTGTDFINNGKFYDAGDNSLNFFSGAKWELGSGATIVRTRSTSNDNLRDNYNTISNIPTNSNWYIIKNSSENPPISTVNSMNYGNLFVLNTTGSVWTTSTSSSFTGSSSYPTIKGNFYIGGSGGVSFLNSNTNANAVLVKGNMTLSSGSTLRHQGTGFEVQGNLTLNGTVDNSVGSAKFILSGINNQTLSGTSVSLSNLVVNKTYADATITLGSTVTVSGAFTFTKGYFVTTSTYPLVFNATSSTTGANDSGFVRGPVKKIGNTAFIFPVGKGHNFQSVGISAPMNLTDAYTAEYFNTGQTIGTATDPTFDYINACEYFNLDRNVGTTDVTVDLGWDMNSCLVNMFPAPRVIGWDGTKWKDLGANSYVYTPFGGTFQSGGPINVYGPITTGNNPNDLTIAIDSAKESNAIRFLENKGQIADVNNSLRPDIKFYSPNTNPQTYFSDSLIYHQFNRIDNTSSNDTIVRVDMRFVNSQATYPVAQRAEEVFSNFYFSHCPQGITDVRSLQRVNYTNIYSGIDVVFSHTTAGLKYTFDIHAGTKPDNLIMKYTGADSVKIISGGKLCIYTVLGNIIYDVPVAFNVDSSTNMNIASFVCHWNITSGNLVSFTFPNGYNNRLPSIIQVSKTTNIQTANPPINNLFWNTNVGKDGFNDASLDVTTDNIKYEYFCGRTTTQNFLPASGSVINNYGGGVDGFVLKFDSAGIARVSTFFGGAGTDVAQSIAFSSSNTSVYIVGSTNSDSIPQIPASNPNNGSYYEHQRAGGTDAFIAKLNSTNLQMTWDSYIGGSANDSARSVTTDPSGNVYVVGNTKSTTTSNNSCLATSGTQFPLCSGTGGAYYQNFNAGDQDIFITKFNSSNNLTWSTLFGSNVKDKVFEVSFVKDTGSVSTGNIVLTGYTEKTSPSGTYNGAVPSNGSFPLCDPTGSTDFFQIGHDAFISQFNQNGNLLWSTNLIGVSEFQTVTSSNKNIYVVGLTSSLGTSSCSPLTNGNVPVCNANGGFNYFGSTISQLYIAGFDKTNRSLVWSSIYGNSNSDFNIISNLPGLPQTNLFYPYDKWIDAVVDSKNNLFFTASSTGETYVQSKSGFYQQNTNASVYGNGVSDAVIASFDSTNNITWSTLMGSGSPQLGGFEYPRFFEVTSAITVIQDKRLFITGYCGPADTTNNGASCIPYPYVSPGYSAAMGGQGYFMNGNWVNTYQYELDCFMTGFELHPDISSGIKNITKDNLNSNLFLFPNPASDLINLEYLLQTNDNLNISVFNTIGQVIYSTNSKAKAGTNKMTLDISNLSTGIYIVQLQGNTVSKSIKFIKE